MENSTVGAPADEAKKCIEILERLVYDGAQLEQLPKDLREALMTAAGRLTRPEPHRTAPAQQTDSKGPPRTPGAQ